MVAMFMFALIVTATAATFSSSYISFRKAKATQRNLEDAQYAMNLIAKTLRTSSIIEPNAVDLADDILLYDHSRLNNQCIRFRLQNVAGNPVLMTKSATAGSKSDCDMGLVPNGIGDMETLSESINDINFYVIPSVNNTTVGRISIVMQVCQNTASCATDEIWIQSSVSLRDYLESGLY